MDFKVKNIKFFRVKDTEIRRAVEVDDAGNKKRVIAILGQVRELLEKELILWDNTEGNLNKWLVILPDGSNVLEYENLEDAKEGARILAWGASL